MGDKRILSPSPHCCFEMDAIPTFKGSPKCQSVKVSKCQNVKMSRCHVPALGAHKKEMVPTSPPAHQLTKHQDTATVPGRRAYLYIGIALTPRWRHQLSIKIHVSWLSTGLASAGRLAPNQTTVLINQYLTQSLLDLSEDGGGVLCYVLYWYSMCPDPRSVPGDGWQREMKLSSRYLQSPPSSLQCQ